MNITLIILKRYTDDLLKTAKPDKMNLSIIECLPTPVNE